MRRREFIRLFSSSAVIVWPLTARAQQAAMPVIGLLGSATASDWRAYVSAFNQGLVTPAMWRGAT
jgi:putative tryptophan/tyrosine transport system substrate-binding protein